MGFYKSGVLSLYFFGALCVANDPNMAQRALPDWFMATLRTTHNVGSGTFVSGYGNNPLFTSTLTLEPTFHLPTQSGWPKMDVMASLDMNASWVESYSTSVFDHHHPMSLSDLKLSYLLPKLWKNPDLGLRFTPKITLITPTSAVSQYLNRVGGVSLVSSLALKKNGFFVELAPSYTAYIYHSTSKWAFCGNSLPASPINPHNADFYLDSIALPQAYAGAGTVSGDFCQLPGRQIMGSLGIPVTLSYGNDQHQIYSNLTWKLGFLRPLESGPESSLYASKQNFKESLLADIGYTYTPPLQTPVNISLGILTQQSIFDAQGYMNFPFFDYKTPNQNQSQIYLDLAFEI